MRIILDECLPRKLKNDIVGHDVSTVTEIGWTSVRNGRLLSLAEAMFDILLTVDRNMEYQQDISSYQLTLIVLLSPDNKRQTLRLLVPDLLDLLPTVESGKVYHVGNRERLSK
jgi:hypothetical protein